MGKLSPGLSKPLPTVTVVLTPISLTPVMSGLLLALVLTLAFEHTFPSAPPPDRTSHRGPIGTGTGRKVAAPCELFSTGWKRARPKPASRTARAACTPRLPTELPGKQGHHAWRAASRVRQPRVHLAKPTSSAGPSELFPDSPDQA